MITFAIIVALATLGAGLAAAVVIRRLPTLRLELVGLSLLAVFLPLAAVLLSGVVMFNSGHDLTILAVAAASSAAAIIAALALARWIHGSLDQLGNSAREFAHGDLTARAPEEGPKEVVELARSFNQMGTSIEQLFDARQELVAWASHDLRTPLASIQAMLEALEDGLAEPDQYLPAIQSQVEKMSGLVDDLFELARIDAGVLTFELAAAPLPGMVESCIRGLEAEAHARHITLKAQINDDVPPVMCAPDKVERVLYNLLTNALRHTPSDGAVGIVVEPRAAEVCVSVEDTGEGFPADSLRRVFDRFWRGDPARSSGGGAGLGLAIASGLVEAQGGRIWAENRPEGGARISFTLPAAS